MWDDLADVIITAGIALVALTGDDPAGARAHLERRLRAVTGRSGV